MAALIDLCGLGFLVTLGDCHHLSSLVLEKIIESLSMIVATSNHWCGGITPGTHGNGHGPHHQGRFSP